jgi:hypothetical protein
MDRVVATAPEDFQPTIRVLANRWITAKEGASGDL